jgi:hypothetical protein
LTLGELAFFDASVASWISVVFATFIWERIAAGLEAVALESAVLAAVLSLRGEPIAPEGIVSRVLSPPAPPSTIPVSVFLLLPEEQDTNTAITTTGVKTVRIIEPPQQNADHHALARCLNGANRCRSPTSTRADGEHLKMN